ncbi:hypothetical protein Dimus_005772 [Dionaea muscipula]
MTSFMDLTYIDYLLTRMKINMPRVIIRHMAYVINVPHYELPNSELLTRIFTAFEVPLDDKRGEEPVKTNFFEETFLGIGQLRRKDGIWWLGSGANRRRDEIEEEDQHEEEVAPAQNEPIEEEKYARSTRAGFQWTQVEEEAQVKGEQQEKEAEIDGSGSVEEYFDAKDDGHTATEDVPTATVVTDEKKKRKSKSSGVDSSGTIPDFDLLRCKLRWTELSKPIPDSTNFTRRSNQTPQPHLDHRNPLA